MITFILSYKEEVLPMIEFISHELYLFVAFMCGLVLGYMVGRRDQE